MRSTAFFLAALAAATSAGVVHQERQIVPVLGGPEVPDADRVCTKSGEKCAGVPGEPAVVFSTCCDDRLVCGVPTAVAAGVWGQFCIAEEDVDVAATQLANAGEGADTATTAPTETDATEETGTADEDDDEDDGDDDTTAVGGGTLAGAEDDDEDEETDDEDEDDSTADGTDEEDDADSDMDEDEDSTIFGTGASASDEFDLGDDESVCFPASATVELQNGDVVSMDSVSIGDMVKVGVDEYSRVFMFTHKMADEAHTFVSLETESGAALSLTSGHYLFVNGALAAAKTVSVGDMLTLGNGETSPVTAVSAKAGTGLFNPQTLNGNVVVDGVLSSTYTTAVEPALAHAMLAPFRVLNNFGLSFTALESGGGVLADLAPGGQPVI